MKTKIYFLLISVIFLLGIFIPHTSYAQENTKQRTTGTYLPNITGQKKEKVADNKKDSNFQLDDGSVKIEIPANIYSKTLRFGIRRIPWSDNAAIPTLKISGESFVGNDVFEITSVENDTGKPVLNFDKNIVITFRYLDEDTQNIKEDTLKLRYFDRLNQTWTDVPTTNKDSNSNSITIKIDHLTLFAITGETKKTTSVFTGGNTNQTNSIPWWQTTLLIIGIIILISIGGWYGYTAYIEATNEIKLEENELSVAGGDPQEISNYPVNNSNNSDNSDKNTNASLTANQLPKEFQNNSPNTNLTNNENIQGGKIPDSDKPPHRDDEIWIDF